MGLRVRLPPGPAVSPYTEELEAMTTRRAPATSAASSTAWVPATLVSQVSANPSPQESCTPALAARW